MRFGAFFSNLRPISESLTSHLISHPVSYAHTSVPFIFRDKSELKHQFRAINSGRLDEEMALGRLASALHFIQLLWLSDSTLVNMFTGKSLAVQAVRLCCAMDGLPNCIHFKASVIGSASFLGNEFPAKHRQALEAVVSDVAQGPQDLSCACELSCSASSSLPSVAFLSSSCCRFVCHQNANGQGCHARVGDLGLSRDVLVGDPLKIPPMRGQTVGSDCVFAYLSCTIGINGGERRGRCVPGSARERLKVLRLFYLIQWQSASRCRLLGP